MFILLVYVDDILALVDKSEAERLRKFLDKKFGKVLFEVSKKLLYLGMEICVDEGGVKVDMSHYTKKILEDEDIVEMKSPVTKATFIVASDAESLVEERRKWFHTKTAKLLYLAKRARPEIFEFFVHPSTMCHGGGRRKVECPRNTRIPGRRPGRRLPRMCPRYKLIFGEIILKI
jgi:predicted peroxiredoxin